MVVIDDLLRRSAFFLGSDRNRNTMLIGTADEQSLTSLKALITRIDIGGQICTGKMSEMNRAVCIW